jgi:hypothetical protein
MAAKKKVDYTLLEADWKTGLKSPAQMAADYELLTGDTVSGQAIEKHFKKLRVLRDKKAAVRARIEEMVVASLVGDSVGAAAEIADEAIVEAAAVKGTEIILAHQKEITRYRKLAQSLLAEIECTTDNIELFDQLGELLRSENERGVDKLNDSYHKVISLPGRVDAFKKLAEVLKILIGLERQASGMADNPDGGKNPPAPDAPPVGTAGITDAARRIAFLFMQATREGGK